jgi:hypothetical protein
VNCISIALYPPQTKATIKRVIEYFCPNDRRGSRIWVDVFVDNPSVSDLTLKILHAGSLSGTDVTEDSWSQANVGEDSCESVLTSRIRELHKEYFPVAIKSSEDSVQLGKDTYHLWKGKLEKVIGGDPSKEVPFTLWQLERLAPGKSVLRLCLEMQKPTFEKRLGSKRSFFAYGEAIVLRNIEDGELPAYPGDDVQEYEEEFAEFKSAHKAPEAFEYLIVSPEREKLLWDAVPLSTSLSPKYIHSGELAKTTRWFTAENTESWELQANVLEVSRLDDVAPETVTSELTATLTAEAR